MPQDYYRPQRPQVSGAYEELVLETVARQLARRILKHGRGAYIGPHEAMGVVQEEVDEAWEAVRLAHGAAHDGPPDATRLAEELLDVAVGALWGVASMVATGRADVELLRPPSVMAPPTEASLKLALGAQVAAGRVVVRHVPAPGGRALELNVGERLGPVDGVELLPARHAHKLETPPGLTMAHQDQLVCSSCGAEATDQEAMALPCPGKRAPSSSRP